MQDGLLAGFSDREMRLLYYPHYANRKLKALMFWVKHFQKTITGESVAISLEDQIDISRGDMLVSTDDLPVINQILTL